MPACKYRINPQVEVTKVATPTGKVHVVATGKFWQGDKSWEHQALCGASITGTPISLKPLTCPDCRAQVTALRDA